jgi:YVTN family beta-propeller protein
MMFHKITGGFLGLFLFSSAVIAAGPTAYVINTTDETLDKINLTSGDVTKNILTLGSDIDCYPNQIVVRDTLAYVIASGTDEIQVINLNSESTAGWINFDPYSNPYWMAFWNDQYLYVTQMLDNSLAKIDVTTRQIVKTVIVGQSPEGILMYGGRAYIAITAYDFSTWSWGQGKVAVYDPEIDTVVAEILVGKNPQFLDFDNQGRIHVACTGDYWTITGMSYIIDPITNSVIDSIDLGGQPGQISITQDNIAFLAAGGWMEDGEVYTYHAVSGEIYHSSSNPIHVDSGSIALVTFQDSTAFVGCFGDKLFQLDRTGTKLNTYLTGDGPAHLDFDYAPGDANGDWEVNVADAVFLVNYIFKDGSGPASPGWRANANGDNDINVGDVVYLVNYVFKGGARPKIGPTWIQ